MDFFEAVRRRRSVRKYLSTPVPKEVIQKSVEAALLAPNSSNIQTARIYRVVDADKKNKMIEACLGQSAARTAQELFVFVAEPSEWRKGQQAVLKALGSNADKGALSYYEKLIPFLYSYKFLAPVKWVIFNVMGLFKPTPRTPWSSSQIANVCVKSTALVAENFMLAMAAQNFDTCPMEGFDSVRVKNTLGLKCSSQVVMVVSVGERAPEGIWGEQFRMDQQHTYFEV